MSKLRYFLLQLRNKLWLKPALTGFGAALWVELALQANDWFEFEPPFMVDRDVLLSLLQILASTMLTVAIFGVSALVSAFSSVTTTASPRANRLLMQDRSTQNALAAFLSAFIYAIIGLCAVSALSYGNIGRFALFVGYVLIVAWVLVSFVRWVDHISKLGRVHDTISRVEEACQDAFRDPAIAGTFGAREALGEDPEGTKLFSTEVGYLLHIDIEEIQAVAEKLDTHIRVLVRPGSFVDRNRPVLVVAGKSEVAPELAKRLRKACTYGTERHVEADPRYGILILTEIADRALSPGVNDPGTAIAVIGSQIRLLTTWVDATREKPECSYTRVEMHPLLAGDLMEDGFSPIARDGAGMFEVGVRLQKAFRSLRDLGHPGLTGAVKLHSTLALSQALEKLPTGYHRERLKTIAREIMDVGVSELGTG